MIRHSVTLCPRFWDTEKAVLVGFGNGSGGSNGLDGMLTPVDTNGAGDIRVIANITTDYAVIAESAIITGDLSVTQSATNKAAATLTINHAVANIDVVTGSLCLFPSSLLHYTIPFEAEEERIVLAFDMIPN